MSAIRPEAREFLIRWSEVFAALVVFVGLWWRRAAMERWHFWAMLWFPLVRLGRSSAGAARGFTARATARALSASTKGNAISGCCRAARSSG